MEFLGLQTEAIFVFLIPKPRLEVQMAGTVDAAARVWVNWALAKNKRKSNEHARFSWFWAIFVIKNWSRVKSSNSNTSSVGSYSWYNWFGCQNLSSLSVSKKNERETNKIVRFSWFWALLLSNSEAEWN